MVRKYKTLPPTALTIAKEEGEEVEAWTKTEEVELRMRRR